MDIDLKQLREMHPLLPVDVALSILGRAAFALERNVHTPGVQLAVDLERISSSCLLSWPGADLTTIDQHDFNRITEDGAEAVALAVAHRHRAWRVIRRMQHGDHADWLLEDARGDRRQEVALEVALEVSGVDRGSIAQRLSEKLVQVAKSVDGDERWACVVGFEKPVTALSSTKRRHRGD